MANYIEANVPTRALHKTKTTSSYGDCIIYTIDMHPLQNLILTFAYIFLNTRVFADQAKTLASWNVVPFLSQGTSFDTQLIGTKLVSLGCEGVCIVCHSDQVGEAKEYYLQYLSVLPICGIMCPSTTYNLQ